MYKLFMAFRYLRAHKIIYFSIAGVALGIMTLVVVTSIMGGFAHDMRSRIRGMQTDIVVISADRNLWFTGYEQLCAEIEKLPHVKGCAPRIEYDAWLGREGTRRDVHFVGILPERERRVSSIEKYFKAGLKENFDFKPDSGRLTTRSGVVVGSEIPGSGSVAGLMTARDATYPILCVKDFDVVGRFSSGLAEYDSSFIFMELSAAQEFLKQEKGSANVLAVAVDDYEKHGRETRRIILDALHERRPCGMPEMHRYGQCGPYLTKLWEHVKATLLTAVEVEQRIMFIVLFLIVVVACFNISAIYTLVIRAKRRDIGILRALGATERGVTSIFLVSGGLCGLIGSFFGICLGLAVALNANEIEAFVRTVSRGMNQIPRSHLAGAAAALALAKAAVIWNWIAFYKPRLAHPWARMVVALVALGAAAWLSSSWAEDGLSWRASAATCILWAAFAAAWRFMDRWRRRPAWVFFGFTGSIVLGALLIGLAALLAIAVSILVNDPQPGWRGLELFPRDIYFLSHIPIYVNYSGIAVIVVMALLVSLIFSIYPAQRAAACDPIEAIRDE